ncbi:hypothetical protein AtubIFM55763_002055 [Aspergillus tubingensis]|uniref:Uncharacterized protein n=1 Tax=Aspergillus tubingensis TaxID=5068 RepID=A0A8H3T694_ASPTU|nr:uncharacterized protein AtWU_11242 [Aspergillus tubingensis]GFN21433.1 hypothetical protein AtWU_11242 [Aspergillus tubingensis]GLA79134.1 hypothetical protein AtubIFM55763_002055 [Aspergillus tubingensis]GLA83753.1 hypothetical protein AtubIFM56815_007959 [Aspergillus tubingensis]
MGGTSFSKGVGVSAVRISTAETQRAYLGTEVDWTVCTAQLKGVEVALFLSLPGGTLLSCSPGRQTQLSTESEVAEFYGQADCGMREQPGTTDTPAGFSC